MIQIKRFFAQVRPYLVFIVLSSMFLALSLPAVSQDSAPQEPALPPPPPPMNWENSSQSVPSSQAPQSDVPLPKPIGVIKPGANSNQPGAFKEAPIQSQNPSARQSPAAQNGNAQPQTAIPQESPARGSQETVLSNPVLQSSSVQQGTQPKTPINDRLKSVELSAYVTQTLYKDIAALTASVSQLKYLLFAIIALVAYILFSLYRMRKHLRLQGILPSKHQLPANKSLVAYIEQNIKAGYSRTSIIQAARMAGHSMDEIERAMAATKK